MKLLRSNPFIFLILQVLATYRLTKLINDDYILNDVRQKVLKKFPPSTSKIGYLFMCPWCMSIWAAGCLLILRKFAPDIYDEITLILTASAITGLLEEKL